MRRTLGTTPLWIIVVLGTCLTAFGVYIQATGHTAFQQMIAGTLAALGGGVIGAVVSIYFSVDEGRDALRAVRDLLTGSLGAQMRSAETDLKVIRRRWHYYYLTERHGKLVWRYYDYHFEQSNTENSIVVVLTDTSFEPPQVYRAEAAVRGNRMILVEEPVIGSEPPIIAVTPFITEHFRNEHAGVVLLRPLGGKQLLSKCLWSLSPLIANQGTDIGPQDAAFLDAKWDEAFHYDTRILLLGEDRPRQTPLPVDLS